MVLLLFWEGMKPFLESKIKVRSKILEETVNQYSLVATLPPQGDPLNLDSWTKALHWPSRSCHVGTTSAFALSSLARVLSRRRCSAEKGTVPRYQCIAKTLLAVAVRGHLERPMPSGGTVNPVIDTAHPWHLVSVLCWYRFTTDPPGGKTDLYRWPISVV